MRPLNPNLPIYLSSWSSPGSSKSGPQNNHKWNLEGKKGVRTIQEMLLTLSPSEDANLHIKGSEKSCNYQEQRKNKAHCDSIHICLLLYSSPRPFRENRNMLGCISIQFVLAGVGY